MIQRIKRYLAIRSYMRRLSRELVRRFGKRPFYSVEHVTKAVQRGGLSAAFITYAHAAYCTQEDFAAHYGPLGLAGDYHSLRDTIARRYFSGRLAFDAITIINRFFASGIDVGFCDSHKGEDGAGDMGGH